jgi:hypothetical protein
MQTSLNINLPKRSFRSNETNSRFIEKAIIGSLFLHLLLLVMKLPEPVVQPKEKLAAIKMKFIAPTESLRAIKKQMELVKKETPKLAGVEKVLTTTEAPLGKPDGTHTETKRSKAGSEKKGPTSSPKIAGSGSGTGTGDGGGYSFTGSGLKTLMGNSATMAMASGSGGGRGVASGHGKGNAGDNLNGEYRAPTGTGDGSGHLLGKDTYGNYDRSTTAKGLANKKGIDTAFVQADTVVLGSIEPEVLRKILQEYLPQFKFCYQQELQENSDKIKGVVDLNFRIEGDGKVSVVNIKAQNAKFSSKGIACMGNILHMIDFPKPKGGGLVDVRQPLNFLSESTKI